MGAGRDKTVLSPPTSDSCATPNAGHATSSPGCDGRQHFNALQASE